MKTELIIKYTVLTAAVLAVLFVPDSFYQDESYSLCIHRNILGVECPLCGMTRAAHALTSLNFQTALLYNFNIFFLPLYVIFDLLAISTRKPVFSGIRKITLILLIIGLIGLYLFRIGRYYDLFA